MRVLEVYNVHAALPRGLRLLEEEGYDAPSRVGDVRVAPFAVCTSYLRPSQKVVLWPQRDYNVAFALYEALWMLAGRRDTKPLDRYVHDYTSRFSDDGKNQHGAYGHRWRYYALDQLEMIADQLKKNPQDRRCVLQMWDVVADLGFTGKDVPCNTIATFQRGKDSELNLHVFCRSNDIIYGAYYANAFHFATLLEYMASWIGCPVGRYEQISVNYHAYKDVMAKMSKLPRSGGDYLSSDPYYVGEVLPTPLPSYHSWCDVMIHELLGLADEGFERGRRGGSSDLFFATAERVLYAHHLWRTLEAPSKYIEAIRVLDEVPALQHQDLTVSMREWIVRRKDAYLAKLVVDHNEGE